MVILSHPRMDKQSATLIRQILLIFSEPEEGKRFKANAMPDPITPVTTQDMNGLDRHIAESK